MRILFLIFCLFFIPASGVADDEKTKNIIMITGGEKEEDLLGLEEIGYDVNHWNLDKSSTIFMRAAGKNKPDVLERMIERGADILLKDPEGKTALSYAAQSNPDPEVINVFIKKRRRYSLHG